MSTLHSNGTVELSDAWFVSPYLRLVAESIGTYGHTMLSAVGLVSSDR